MALNGKLVFRGQYGGTKNTHTKTCGAFEPLTNTALYNFCLVLDDYTLCKINKRVCVFEYEYSGGAVTNGANVDEIATIFFSEEGTHGVKRFSFPAPVASARELRSEGERIKDSVVTTLVSALATMSGKTLFPLYGIVRQRR